MVKKVLLNEDIKSLKSKNLLAYSFVEDRGMEDAGEMEFFFKKDKEVVVYTCNFLERTFDFSYFNKKLRMKILEDDTYRGPRPGGHESYYMGWGHNLVVNKRVGDHFWRKHPDLTHIMLRDNYHEMIEQYARI